MAAKILLADKSITIQKVVEMLFSGKDYEVTCVSDGENALSEAGRIRPDVILADVDLPRIDGYTLAAQARQQAALAQIPIILMLSRDDQYDAARGSQAGIVDNIAKPFESKDLISKVKKALTAAPAKGPAPAPRPAQAAPPPPPPKPAAPPPPPPPPKPKQAVPSDIFGIIDEAPAAAAPVKAAPPAPKKAPAPPVEESVFEVEPEVEVEPEEVAPPPKPAPPRPVVEAPVAREWKAPVEEAQQIAEPDAFDTEKLFGREAPQEAEEQFVEAEIEETVQAEVVSEPPSETGFDTFDMGGGEVAAEAEKALPLGARAMEEMRAGLGLGEAAAADGGKTAAPPDFVSFENLDDASRVSHDDYTPPAAAKPRQPAAQPAGGMPVAASEEQQQIAAQDAIARVAREVLERVAWEVIPELAERLIREEIERLKAGK